MKEANKISGFKSSAGWTAPKTLRFLASYEVGLSTMNTNKLENFMKKLTSLSLLTLIVTLLSASTASAAIKTWTNTVGSAWTTAANWSPSGAPAAGDDVIIGVDVTGNITAVPTITLRSLTNNGSALLAASLSGNTLTVTNYYVAAGKTNTLGATGARLVFTLAATGTGTVNGNCAFDAGTTVRDFTVNGTLIVNPSGRVFDPIFQWVVFSF